MKIFLLPDLFVFFISLRPICPHHTKQTAQQDKAPFHAALTRADDIPAVLGVDMNQSKADINFLWGGRDSGKSHYIAQRLIRKCLKARFFRCIMVKKT
ncbi:MAG: hypothetical protein V4495_21950, partial [Pseudomonadota bacterium]